MSQKQVRMDPESLSTKLPAGPGVYLFKDGSDRIIYVGKAKNLKKRVLSYFRPTSDLSHKTALMMNKAKGLDFILTSTENEAFILESSLIKKHLPRYNIILRDDKQYPCLRLGIREEYPRLGTVRRIKKDGAIYFGPFSSSSAVRSTLKLIEKVFLLRKCKGSVLPKRSRPCLNHQLGRCLGPCVKGVSVEEYRQIVEQVRMFLEGRNRELINQLKTEMRVSSEQLNFEAAARTRDQIRAVQSTIERQNVVSSRLEDQDVIAIVSQDGVFLVTIFFVRKGYLIGSRDYVFRDKEASSTEILDAFIKQYYLNEKFIPKSILVSEALDELPPISAWLSDMAGSRVSILLPLRGEKRRIIEIALSNATNRLSKGGTVDGRDLMEMVMSALRLKRVPRSIEGLDISNLQGDMAVGTIVSFVDGIPNRSGYRNYRIRGVEGVDDYGMMSELAARRLSGGDPPDLLLVDGGKGHLQAVLKAMESIPEKAMPDVAAIAKAKELGSGDTDRVYVPGRKNPLSLDKGDPVLLLLMRIRDEAHRRAVSYHRKIRLKGLKDSRLDQIPNIGSTRKRNLLRKFGDLDAISRASIEELISVPGISGCLAEEILKALRQ